MFNLFRTLGFTTLALAGMSLTADDLGPLMKVARNTWPEKTTIGVVCNYLHSAKEVQALAEAAGPGTLIQVVDIHRRDQLLEAGRRLMAASPDYLVLLSHDSAVPDYSIEATFLVRHLADHGVPSISTSSVALKQGAVFALGERTHGRLEVCNKPIGTISVILPNRETQTQMASNQQGSASVQVASLR
jgi:hypothetical protein